MDKLNFGIKGSVDKGDFIINWLETLGGENIKSLTGTITGCIYSIDLETKEIVSCFDNETSQEQFCKIYTVEDFKSEYPFSRGDRIDFQNGLVEEIVKVRWDPILGDMIYTAKSGAVRSLNPNDKIINKIDFTDGHYDNEVELILAENQEAIIENGKIKIIKKLYPYTFQECCEIMRICPGGELQYDYDIDDASSKFDTKYEDTLIDKLDAFRKLIICRDAYRKLYRDEHDETEMIYTIQWDSKINNIIKKTNLVPLNVVLSFYTEDMRDTFARKFDEYIKKCKDFI
jgi:hypothetical protein